MRFLRKMTTRLVAAATPLMLVVWANVDSLHADDPPTATAGEQDKETVARTLSLKDVFSTSPQKGLKHIHPSVRYDEETGEREFIPQHGISGEHFERLYSVAAESYNANIFLVRGDSIAEAMLATHRVIVNDTSIRMAVTARQRSATQSDQAWLVVHLGHASSEPGWIVTSCTIRDDKIRLSYRWRNPPGAPANLLPYLVWVPLGELATDKYYFLELFDEDDKQMDLMRRVWIPGKENR